MDPHSIIGSIRVATKILTLVLALSFEYPNAVLLNLLHSAGYYGLTLNRCVLVFLWAHLFRCEYLLYCGCVEYLCLKKYSHRTPRV